jgi:hypothetical protein
MKEFTIEAKLPKNEKKGRPADKNGIAKVMFPDYKADADAALEEAKKAYGSMAILTNAFSNATVTIQAGIRSCLEKGSDIQTKFAGWKLGVATAKAVVDPKAAFMAMFQSATPEERKKMLAELQGK